MKRLVSWTAAAMILGSIGAQADQQLLPAPYPQQYGPNALSIPTQHYGYHQHLLNDAAPESLGPYAQGNPLPYRAHIHRYRSFYRVHRLLPTPYPR